MHETIIRSALLVMFIRNNGDASLIDLTLDAVLCCAVLCCAVLCCAVTLDAGCWMLEAAMHAG